MAKKIPGWILGCGIVGIVAVLVLVALGVGGAMLIRDAAQEFEGADAAMETVAQTYGPIGDFRPIPDGSIPTARMEAFLAAREASAPRRAAMDSTLTILSDPESGTFSRMRAGAGLLHGLARFVEQRNTALLETEMGLGEYYYIYTLAYYAWLEKSPADGPAFKLVGANGYVLENIEELEEADARAFREEQARTSLNRLLLPVLRSQLSDLSSAPEAESTAAWRRALETEIAALDADERRLPWEGTLPDDIAVSLGPYRDELERSYSAMCNALEIGIARR